MAKKGKKNQQPANPSPNPQQKATFSRLNFLYQSAVYLSTHSPSPSRNIDQAKQKDQDGAVTINDKIEIHKGNTEEEPIRYSQSRSNSKPSTAKPPTYSQPPLSNHLVQTLISTARKTVTRLDRSIKRTICKCCNALLIPGISCSTTVENTSRGRKKPHADVVVVTCDGCGTGKRYPVQQQNLQPEAVKSGRVTKPRGRKGKKTNRNKEKG